MSEALPLDADIAILARFVARDAVAAEHVHAKLLASDDVAEIADLSRSYQRMTRSLRQTVALKAKLTAEQAQAAEARRAKAPAPVKRNHEAEQADRIFDLQDAVARMAYAAGHRDAAAQDALFERFDAELDDWAERPDFTTADLDLQVRAACRLLDLPAALAPAWRALPHPETADAPWADPDDAPARSTALPPAPPRESSG